MKQINLLPQAVQRRAAKRSLAVATGASALLALGLTFGMQATLAHDSQVLQESIDRQSTERAASSAGLQKDAGITADLQSRVAQYNTLAKSEVNWSKAMQLVGTVIPQDIQLGSYSYGSAPTGLTLKMSGKASSILSFAVFVQALQSNPSITAPKVDGYTYDPASGTVTFSLTTTVPAAQVTYPVAKTK